jgi:hypothetical protein
MKVKSAEHIEVVIFKGKIERKISLSGYKLPNISEEKKMVYIPSENLIFCPDGFEGVPVVISVEKDFFILAKNRLGRKKLSSKMVETIVLHGKTFAILSNPLIKTLFDLK